MGLLGVVVDELFDAGLYELGFGEDLVGGRWVGRHALTCIGLLSSE
jgi:hypothetical protein